MFIGKRGAWEIDADGRLVISLKEAKELADHLRWQFESESKYVAIYGSPDEDG